MIKGVQAARAAACLMVLFSHASAIIALPKYFGRVPFGGILRVGDIGVDLFFVISGFIIFSVHSQDIGRPSFLARYARKRFQRIYPLYWIVTVLLLIMVLLGVGDTRHHYSLLAIMDFISLVDVSSAVNPNPVAWSLYYEVLFYTLFALLIASRKAGLSLIIVVIIALLVRVILDTVHGFRNTPFNDVSLHYYLIAEFALGFLVWKYSQNVKLVVGRLAFISGVILLPVTIMAVDIYVTRETWPPIRTLYGIPFALLLIGVIRLEKTNGSSIPRSVTYIGNASFSIYLTHFLLQSFICKTLVRVEFVHATSIYIIFGLVASSSLGASLLFYQFLERPLVESLRRRSRSSSSPMTRVSKV